MTPSNRVVQAFAICFALLSGLLNCGAQSPPANYPTLDANAYSTILGGGILALNYMRLAPGALDDDLILRAFVSFNNCHDRRINNILSNELDYPQVAAFYKARATPILAGAPSVLFQDFWISLGDYDSARGEFPVAGEHNGNRREFKQVTSGSYDVIEGSGCYGSPFVFTPGSPFFPSYGARDPRGIGVRLQVAYKPFALTEIPMDEAAARKCIEYMQQNHTRDLPLVVAIEILQTPPRTFVDPEFGPTIVFAGQVKEANLRNWAHSAPPYASVKTIATLNLYGGFKPTSAASGPSASSNPQPIGGDAGRLDIKQQAMAFYYKKQYQAAFNLSEGACTSGNQDLCGLEGILYGSGLGVPVDLGRAKDLMTKSCEAGSSEGCDALGAAYLKGVSVPKDKNKAFELFNRSCDGGYYEGCADLSQCYRFGDGVRRDVRKSEALFDRACTLGHEDFSAACDGGNGDACIDLSTCYLDGAGVEKDRSKAKALIQMVCTKLDQRACDLLRFYP